MTPSLNKLSRQEEKQTENDVAMERIFFLVRRATLLKFETAERRKTKRINGI